jgi:hypothetical protein
LKTGTARTAGFMDFYSTLHDETAEDGASSELRAGYRVLAMMEKTVSLPLDTPPFTMRP